MRAGQVHWELAKPRGGYEEGMSWGGRLIRHNSPFLSLLCRSKLRASTWILMPESAGGIICGLYLHFPCGTQISFHIQLVAGEAYYHSCPLKGLVSTPGVAGKAKDIK